MSPCKNTYDVMQDQASAAVALALDIAIVPCTMHARLLTQGCVTISGTHTCVDLD